MAAVNGVRSVHAIIGANIEDVVTLSGAAGGVGAAEISHHGGAITDVIYFRTDGVAAIKAAAETQVLLPGERLSLNMRGTGVVSLICNGAAGYSVNLL